jgi:hypothetical protein
MPNDKDFKIIYMTDEHWGLDYKDTVLLIICHAFIHGGSIPHPSKPQPYFNFASLYLSGAADRNFSHFISLVVTGRGSQRVTCSVNCMRSVCIPWPSSKGWVP